MFFLELLFYILLCKSGIIASAFYDRIVLWIEFRSALFSIIYCIFYFELFSVPKFYNAKWDGKFHNQLKVRNFVFKYRNTDNRSWSNAIEVVGAKHRPPSEQWKRMPPLTKNPGYVAVWTIPRYHGLKDFPDELLAKNWFDHVTSLDIAI